MHLGARVRSSALTRREPLDRLLAAVDDVDRLVLLGDVVELLEGRTAHAMGVAQPVLEAIGARLGSGREAILVPGNHDRRLVGSWVRAQGTGLTSDAVVPVEATPALARVTSWLAPASVRVHYPGVWLSDRVWATHGHYLDRHLLPTSAFGIARGLLGRLPREEALPVDYERAGGPSVTRVEAWLTRWLPRPLATMVEDFAELVRASTMPRVPKALLHRRMAPLLADRKSTRLNSSHPSISYAVFCLKKKTTVPRSL